MSTAFEDTLRVTLAAVEPQRIEVEGARAAAVLIPIVGKPQPSLIFTVRTDTLSSHKGQIAFPGGKVDSGESAEDAALRETHEEIGLDPRLVRIIGELDTTPTFVSGYTVTPLVGWIDEPPELVPNPREVAKILRVPVDALSEGIRREAGFQHGDRSFPTEGWVWEDNVIWGVTARILRSFLSHLADAGLAERPGETTSWDWARNVGAAGAAPGVAPPP